MVEFLRSALPGFVQVAQIFRQRRQRRRLRDRTIVVLEAFCYTGKEKRGQDRGMLPIEQADTFQLESELGDLGMTDAEMTEGRVPGDE